MEIIQALLAPPAPSRIRLLKDMIFFLEYPGTPYKSAPFVCVLRAGEEAEYFEHSDKYIFAERDDQVPYFSRHVLARLPEFIEVVAG